MIANERQVGGDHYRKIEGEQHWDRVVRLGLNYFQAMITRYVERYRDKGGVEDLRKAQHFLEKLIELEESRVVQCDSKPAAAGGGTRDTLWHLVESDKPDVARCGASFAGMMTSTDPSTTTCDECLLK